MFDAGKIRRTRILFGHDLTPKEMALEVIKLINEERRKAGLLPMPKTRRDAAEILRQQEIGKPKWDPFASLKPAGEAPTEAVTVYLEDDMHEEEGE